MLHLNTRQIGSACLIISICCLLVVPAGVAQTTATPAETTVSEKISLQASQQSTPIEDSENESSQQNGDSAPSNTPTISGEEYKRKINNIIEEQESSQSSSPSPPAVSARESEENKKENKDKKKNKDDEKSGSGLNPNISERDGGGYGVDIGLVTVPMGDIIAQIGQYIIDDFGGAIAKLVNEFNHMMFDLPAPGTSDDVSSWFSAGGWWKTVYGTYGIMSALAIALLLPSLMIAVDTVDPHRRKQRLLELGKAGTIGILVGFPLTALGLHLGNAITGVIVPSGSEFLTSSGSIAHLGIGIILAFILLMTQFTVVVIGILVVMLQDLLTYLVVAFWPIFWAFTVQPSSTLRSYGKMGISMYFLLIVLKFTQVAILRFLYLIPLDSNPIVSLITILIGVTVVFIGLPYVALRKMVPGSAMLIRGANHFREDKPVEVEVYNKDDS